MQSRLEAPPATHPFFRASISTKNIRRLLRSRLANGISSTYCVFKGAPRRTAWHLQNDGVHLTIATAIADLATRHSTISRTFEDRRSKIEHRTLDVEHQTPNTSPSPHLIPLDPPSPSLLARRLKLQMHTVCVCLEHDGRRDGLQMDGA